MQVQTMTANRPSSNLPLGSDMPAHVKDAAVAADLMAGRDGESHARVLRYTHYVSWWLSRVAQPAAEKGLDLQTPEALAFAILLLSEGVDVDKPEPTYFYSGGLFLDEGVNSPLVDELPDRIIRCCSARMQADAYSMDGLPYGSDGYRVPSLWLCILNLLSAANSGDGDTVVVLGQR